MEDGSTPLLGWAYAGGSDGARSVLSVIASSMITVAGVVFSITIVALQLASTQFGPRVLRNFMRDRGNQVVLGTFVATFVYCLLVLRTTRGGDEELVPALSVTVAVMMAIVSLGVLIFYIHHAAVSIQASHVVSTIGEEVFEAIDRVFPEKDDDRERPHVPPTGSFEHVSAEGLRIPLRRTGYLQRVDETLLVQIARDHDLVIELATRPGSFMRNDSPVAVAWPPERATDSIAHAVRESVSLGSERTHEQDVLFATDQLIEVALRALSPSINDPFTAMSCIDWFGAAVVRRLGRDAPTPWHFDSEGNVRLITHPVRFEELMETGFGRLRTYVTTHPMVLRHMLTTLRDLMQHARTEAQRRAIAEHAERILAEAERVLEFEPDLKALRELASEVAAA